MDGITLLVALIAACVAFVGLIAQQRATARHRFTDRRQALYVDLWIECQQHHQQVADQVGWRWSGRHGKSPTVASTAQAERCVLALDLIAPWAIRRAARALLESTVLLGTRFARDESDLWAPEQEDWERLTTHWDMRAKDYLALAQHNLRNPG